MKKNKKKREKNLASKQLKLRRKKIRKKIGSNVENLRKFEPQPEQTFLIKKKCISLCVLDC